MFETFAAMGGSRIGKATTASGESRSAVMIAVVATRLDPPVARSGQPPMLQVALNEVPADRARVLVGPLTLTWTALLLTAFEPATTSNSV